MKLSSKGRAVYSAIGLLFAASAIYLGMQEGWLAAAFPLLIVLMFGVPAATGRDNVSAAKLPRWCQSLFEPGQDPPPAL
jgi:hypothetical protein